MSADVKAEIERKLLLRRLPETLVPEHGCYIRQGYLHMLARGFEIRLRQKGEKFFVTQKGKESFCRQEKEAEISREAFDILWPATVGRRVEKVRHIIVGPGGFVWEVDEFLGALKGLVIAEVELPDVHTDAITPQSIQSVFLREVTGSIGYYNRNLAQHGFPSG